MQFFQVKKNETSVTTYLRGHFDAESLSYLVEFIHWKVLLATTTLATFVVHVGLDETCKLTTSLLQNIGHLLALIRLLFQLSRQQMWCWMCRSFLVLLGRLNRRRTWAHSFLSPLCSIHSWGSFHNAFLWLMLLDLQLVVLNHFTELTSVGLLVEIICFPTAFS